MSFIESCRKIVSIDTTPHSGSVDACLMLAELCRSKGLYVELQNESWRGIDQCNLIARSFTSISEGELLLQNHLDTVDPGTYALWTKTESNPFNASIYDDTIYGLGVADVKLDLICKIEAAGRVLQKHGIQKLKRPFVIAGTYGEASGMNGVLKLVRRGKVKAKYALVGEPTQLQLLNQGAGVASMEAIIPFSEEEIRYQHEHDMMDSSSSQSKMFSGRMAHSSQPQLGDNAIMKMFDFLSKLPEGISVMDMDGGTNMSSVPSSAIIEFDMVGSIKDTIVPKITRVVNALKSVERSFEKYEDKDFSPSKPSMNIGLVRTTSEGIMISGSCRMFANVPEEVYQSWMGVIKSACDDVGAAFKILDYKHPFSTSVDNEFVQACQRILADANGNQRIGSTSVCTEASVLKRLGTTCLVFGPGQGVGNSHEPNERIKISDLEFATDFYEKAIEAYCL